MGHQTSERGQCFGCGEHYTASVEHRLGDRPEVLRSDEWLDGHRYCPVCLDTLESER